MDSPRAQSPGESAKLDEYIRRLQKIGIKWQSPPAKLEELKELALEPTCFSKTDGHKARSREVNTTASVSDSESESEMMGRGCVTDLTGQVAKQKEMVKRSVAVGKAVSAKEAAKLDQEAFRDLGLNQGDKPDQDEPMIPWKFLVRYGELYVGKANTPIVEPYFDPSSILENQDWDVFYLYEPADLSAEPIFFVPTCQLDAYLRKINKKEGIALTIPGGGNEVKFCRLFGWLSTPKPRYLGRTNGDGSLQKLAAAIPLPEPEDDLSKAPQAEQEGFVTLLENIKQSCTGGNGNGKGSRARKKAMTRYENRKAWGHTTKRVQRYLGLREKRSCSVSYAVYIGQEECASKTAFDVQLPAPSKTEDDVMLICVDVETFEKSPSLVTEIGFAILDTRLLHGVHPGEGARNWFELIQGRHLRIKEYKHIRNRQYVKGWPEHFQFGKSEVLGIEKIAQTCNEILAPKSSSGEPRKVVIVGHDINQDIALLNGIDVDIFDLPGLVEIVDNQRMQQHHSRFRDPQRLSFVLSSLDIPHCYLHNAGNDAVYTLQSMLALAVIKRQASLSKEPKQKAQRDPSLQREFGEPLIDAGWSTGGEGTDGGLAPRLVDPNAHLKGTCR